MSGYRPCPNEAGWFATGAAAGHAPVAAGRAPVAVGRAPVGYVARHSAHQDGYAVGALLTDIMLLLAERGLRPSIWGEDVGTACAALAQTLYLLGIDPTDRDGSAIVELGALVGPPAPEID